MSGGSIAIDGQDIRSVSLRSLRRAVGVVQQDAFLFTTSIENNIVYGDPWAKEQRIERAARESGIDVKRAARRQKREDQLRADISLEYYQWDPREDERYDLVVNTGTMDLDTCVQIIVAASKIKASSARAAAH